MAIKTEFVTITPDLALRYLEDNSHNRPVRQSTVQRYARDMAEGRWQLTHQGISFDTNGVLLDGQHRLWAIVESKTPIELLVVFGLPPESHTALDHGLTRSTADVLTLRDSEFLTSQQQGDIKLATSVATWLATQHNANQRHPSRAEQLEMYDRHRSRIMAAVDLFPRSPNTVRIRKVSVVAVFARALYSRTAVDLAPVADVLRTGMQSQPIDRVLILLRNVLLLQRPRDWESYWKTERALRAYIENDPIKYLVEAEREYFPIPGETTIAENTESPAAKRRAQLRRNREQQMRRSLDYRQRKVSPAAPAVEFRR